ncbi:BamA/TamA family outer membrane protein [Pollutibacter soli]|uniref:BamA/TamA family outer membrane protein n=1 Tax=Pollutibacter soli TaxID=3034157 RepID=UPI00301354A7
MNKLLFILILCLVQTFSTDAQERDSITFRTQKDVIDILRNIFNLDKKKFDSTRLNRKVQFSFVPSAATAPGGGRAIVTAFNAAFFLGDQSTTSLSAVTFTPWFTFDGKFVLPFRNMIWLPNDFLFWRGDTRFMVYPQYTWGLGGRNDKENKALLNYNYLRFNHSLLKKVGRFFFLGAGYNVDYHFNVRLDGDSTDITDIPIFDYELKKQSVSTGPQFNIMIDTRKNSINPSDGFYFQADYRFNIKSLGSTTDWQSIYIDVRKYIPFEKKRQNLLALWAYYWSVVSGNAPYLDLPSIGWDPSNKSGRGFQQNRYKSRHLVNGEIEYRRDITKNGLWGFVLFANLNAVSEYYGGHFTYWHPAGGAGVRIKFNKISRSNIAVDFGMSKDYMGVYLSLGEFF